MGSSQLLAAFEVPKDADLLPRAFPQAHEHPRQLFPYRVTDDDRAPDSALGNSAPCQDFDAVLVDFCEVCLSYVMEL